MVIQNLEPDLTLRHLSTAEELAPFRAGFIGAYQTVFSGFPYHERFYPAEAEGIFRKLTETPDHVTILVTRGTSQVIGFGVGVPLKHKLDIAPELTGLVPVRHTFCLAELGVLPQYRRSGLGQKLIRERMLRIDRTKYSHVVVRVPEKQPLTQQLYEEMGFEEMGVHMSVRSMRTDGRVTTDRRHFLCCVLSQIPME